MTDWTTFGGAKVCPTCRILKMLNGDCLCTIGELRQQLAAETQARKDAEAGLAEFSVMQQCLREAEEDLKLHREQQELDMAMIEGYMNRAQRAEAQIAMDSENIRRMQEAGHAAEAREAVLLEALDRGRQTVELVMERWFQDVGEEINRHPLAVSSAKAFIDSLSTLPDRTAKLLKVVEALKYVARVRESFPKGHSRHLILKLAEGKAREALREWEG